MLFVQIPEQVLSELVLDTKLLDLRSDYLID